MGDGIQAAKAGILEIGDVYVVNKADRDGADTAARELRHMLTLGERARPAAWRPPVVKTVASPGEGIDELVAALDAHAAWLAASGNARRAAAGAASAPRSRRSPSTPAPPPPRATAPPTASTSTPSPTRVLAGDLDPYTAADLVTAVAAQGHLVPAS